MFSGLTALVCATFLGNPSLFSQDVVPVPAVPVTEVDLTKLEELVAPIALYPDALIALILPAATSSADIVLAAPFLKGGGNQTQIENQPWDDSVKGLAHYPDVVKWMDENLAWTQRIGEAYLDQPAEVMNAIQRARAHARANGVLSDTPQQRIVIEDEYIRIIPAQRDVIYVPRYDPEIIYVQRPAYYYPDPWLTFGIGFGVGSWLAYDLDWRHCVIWVDHHRHERWSHHRDWRDRSFAGRHGQIGRDSHWQPWKPLPGRVHRPHRDSHRWRNDGIARPSPIPGSPRFDRERWKDRTERFGSRHREGGNRPGVERNHSDRSRDLRSRNRPSAGAFNRPSVDLNPGATSGTPTPRRETPRVYRVPRVNEAGEAQRSPADRPSRREGDRRFSERRRESGGTLSTVPSTRRGHPPGSQGSRFRSEGERRRNPSISDGAPRNGSGASSVRSAPPQQRSFASRAVRPSTHPRVLPQQAQQAARPTMPPRVVPQQRTIHQPDRIGRPSSAPAQVRQHSAPQVRDTPRQVHVDRGSGAQMSRRGGGEGRTSRDRRAER